MWDHIHLNIQIQSPEGSLNRKKKEIELFQYGEILVGN